MKRKRVLMVTRSWAFLTVTGHEFARCVCGARILFVPDLGPRSCYECGLPYEATEEEVALTALGRPWEFRVPVACPDGFAATVVGTVPVSVVWDVGCRRFGGAVYVYTRCPNGLWYHVGTCPIPADYKLIPTALRYAEEVWGRFKRKEDSWSLRGRESS
jgi:hypothetical protein